MYILQNICNNLKCKYCNSSNNINKFAKQKDIYYILFTIIYISYIEDVKNIYYGKRDNVYIIYIYCI